MAHQHTPRFLKIVEEAKSRVRETTIDDVIAVPGKGVSGEGEPLGSGFMLASLEWVQAISNLRRRRL